MGKEMKGVGWDPPAFHPRLSSLASQLSLKGSKPPGLGKTVEKEN